MSDDRNNDTVKAISTGGDSEDWKRALRANSADARSFSQSQWTTANSTLTPSSSPPTTPPSALATPQTQTVAGTSSGANGTTSTAVPPQNANMMPGGTEHTAGGKASDVTLSDAAKSIKKDDWLVFHKKPCVKDSFLVGIGSGFAAGSLRAIWRAPLMTACNWAVGTFCFGSFFMYQYCNFQRVAEKEGMKRAMEIIDRKAIERKQKEARLERIREVRRQKKEEDDQATFAALQQQKSGEVKSSWKFW